jgi:16S rRNA (guanine527-N7)-methyltransferase
MHKTGMQELMLFQKDIDELYSRHILHSLGIAKIQSFVAGSYVLDDIWHWRFQNSVAILFPDTRFLFSDIVLKIRVVNEVATGLGL